MKSKAMALRPIATETRRRYYAAYDPYVNREPSAGELEFIENNCARPPIHRRHTINLSLAKRISHSSLWPTGHNYRSVSLSAEEMLAWQILAGAKWRELSRLDLSRKGVGWFDWR